MPIALSNQMSMSVDVAITLKRGSEMGLPAVIDWELVSLLIEIEDKGSVSEACARLNRSTRQAQRMLKRFTNGSGLILLKHHGQKGTSLSDEARQCIALYVASLQCTEQLLQKNPLPRPLPPLNGYPTEHDWDHRS